MMMNRAKTAPSSEAHELTTPTFSVQHAKSPLSTSAEKCVHDLERPPPAATTAAAPSASLTGNPLLKRIRAVQERTRRAEQQEKDTASQRLRAAQAQEEEALVARASALPHATDSALEDEQNEKEDTHNEILRQLEGKHESLPVVLPGVPIMTSLDTPPPSFNSMKFPPPRMQQPPMPGMVGHGMNSRALTQEQPSAAAPPATPAPPSFDPPPAPTAPHYEDHLYGIQPLAPPPAMPPPPSFAEFEHTTETAAVEDEDNIAPFLTGSYETEGNTLTPQQREAMIDEQRRLYERIMEENSARSNDTAANKADMFDARSANAAARALPGGDAHAVRNMAMDALGQDVRADDPVRRTVQIGPNQTAAIHGQDRTKQAIKNGTAILVQCLSCHNWLQVTNTATLMMCPVCQVVSPVVPQDQVLTKEEAIQLTMDRKMAEELQAEAYADADEEEGSQGGGAGFFGSLFGGGGEATPAEEGAASLGTTINEKGGAKMRTAAPATAPVAAASDSWWETMTSLISYGVATSPAERGDLGVTRPPGNPGAQQQARSPSGIHDPPASRGEETRGLLTPAVVDGDGNATQFPAGRIAEQRPLFLCVVDGVLNAASAVFSTDAAGDVEESNALMVTNAGRGVGDGVGEYARVPDERL